MWQLYQYPLCPHSRTVRLVMGEKGIAHNLVREHPWERRDEFLDLNPAGETPVLVEDRSGDVLIGTQAICEYLDETNPKTPMLEGSAAARAEVRRLADWFGRKMWQDVVAPLLEEKMFKRIISRASPDTVRLRESMRAANGHLDYMDYLLDHRRWLAGSRLSLADFAAAAQLSVVDYLGALDWRGHENAKNWYAVMKSRPGFRPLLGERMEGVAPPAHYDKVDF
ncbi:glutathione S-transferase family protein [Sphingomicrobium sediminis]|uniref:Glutathione S-transferase family protein n=1 Tax=Sphingomicrobium sediminis TaxID=2950949 RepID=A0A9X2J4Y4_9SPHN|nr:glutathione S-transferase family protein [Sphingomicrobium sediminis]MCM8557682.1 glutathione S-transferase family protein [Sphingomicrobium sediminis]